MIPAQRKADVELASSVRDNEVLLFIRNRNFFSVQTWPDEENNTVKSRASIDGQRWHYWRGNTGYDYLFQQFSADAKQILNDLDSRNPDY